MNKRFLSSVALLLGMVVVLTGCPNPKKPLSEVIAKAWTAQKVEHGSTTVYTKGASSNTVAGYSQFSLNLTSPTSAVLKEFDGNTFTGQWELQGDTKLILKNLSPQPTATNGTIEFTINSASDNELVLTRTTASQKTGGTINKYTLTNP